MEALRINGLPSIAGVEAELGPLSNPNEASLHGVAKSNLSLHHKDIRNSAAVVGSIFAPTFPLTHVHLPKKLDEPILDAKLTCGNIFGPAVHSPVHSTQMHILKNMHESSQDVALINDSVFYYTAQSHMLSMGESCQDVDVFVREGTPMSLEVSYVLLHECMTKKDLVAGRRVHLQLVSSGLDLMPAVGDNLIRLFDSCGSLHEADLVFCKVAKPSVSTWHAIMSAHAARGKSDRALEIYIRMEREDIVPDSFVFTCVLKSCASMGALRQGQLVHEHIIKTGLQSDLFVASTLIDFYAKCGSVQKASIVFNMLPYKNVVTWSAMIVGYIQQGHAGSALQLFEEMQQEGVEPNEVTYSSILNACASLGDLWQGMRLHNQLIGNGLESDSLIGNTLVDMYAKCGSLEEAQEVFHELPNQNLVSWNTLIAGYAQNEHGLAALQVFKNMEMEGIRPNKITLSCVLKACGSIGAIWEGKLIHDHIIRSGLESDEYIQSSLIDMYCKCGSLDEAHRIFYKWTGQNVVSWGAMMAGYAQHNLGLSALDLFVKMQEAGIKPNKYVFSSVLKACSSIGSLEQGINLHEQIRRSGLGICAFVGSSLIDMYAKCGSLEAAHKVFEELPCRDVVSWGAMIAGYAQHGHPLSALQLYEKMQWEGTEPDKAIYMCLLEACGAMGTMWQGQVIHYQIIARGLKSDVMIGNSLINMYIKCEGLEEAQSVFNALQSRNEVSWGAMVAAYAQHSNCLLARQYLKVMLEEGLMPDEKLFTSVLSACSRAGQLEEGLKFFRSMREVYGIKPSIQHFGCMVDLLGQGGYLIEAEELLESLSVPPDSTAWMSLLSSCRTYSNVELGSKCFNQLIRLDSGMAVGYVLMSNIYADAGMWENAQEMDEQRKRADAWKIPGRAWIEVNKEVHEFVVGDTTHPESDRIYANLRRLSLLLKDEGYVPQLGAVAEAPPEKNKEDALLGHCEKLAIAFGLLSTPGGATLRIVKNLRVCVDCHNASKIISRVESREIVINDSYRIHHFNDGVCSCEQSCKSG